jgi:hypothetical protein
VHGFPLPARGVPCVPTRLDQHTGPWVGADLAGHDWRTVEQQRGRPSGQANTAVVFDLPEVDRQPEPHHHAPKQAAPGPRRPSPRSRARRGGPGRTVRRRTALGYVFKVLGRRAAERVLMTGARDMYARASHRAGVCEHPPVRLGRVAGQCQRAAPTPARCARRGSINSSPHRVPRQDPNPATRHRSRPRTGSVPPLTSARGRAHPWRQVAASADGGPPTKRWPSSTPVR